MVQFCIFVIADLLYYANFNTLYYLTLSSLGNQKVGRKYVIEGESNYFDSTCSKYFFEPDDQTTAPSQYFFNVVSQDNSAAYFV